MCKGIFRKFLNRVQLFKKNNKSNIENNEQDNEDKNTITWDVVD